MRVKKTLTIISHTIVLATSGCVHSSRTAPVANHPISEGDAVGRCLFDNGVRECPPELSELYLKSNTSRNVREYSYGILNAGGKIAAPLAAMGNVVSNYGHETLAEKMTSAQLKPTADLDVVALEHLADSAMNICAVRPPDLKGFIVSEYIGCSVYGKGIEVDTAGSLWSVDTLASAGVVQGEPKGFWFQSPGLKAAPSQPTCDKKVVVWIDVRPLPELCNTVVHGVQVRAINARAKLQLTEANALIARLNAQINQLTKQLEDVKAGQQSAELQAKVLAAQLELTKELLKEQEKAKNQLAEALSKINSLVVEPVTIPAPKPE